VTGASEAGALTLACYTGSDALSDNTGGGVLPCDATPSKKVYYWATDDPSAPDQQVYAAKDGSVVVVVPRQTASDFHTFGGGLAGVMLAVGVC
jgi:hypothetical protein